MTFPKTIIIVFFTPLIIAILLMAAGTIWFHSLPQEEQDRLSSESVANECNSSLPMVNTYHHNGTFSPFTNSSKLCEQILHPYAIQQTRIVTVAGYESGWLGDCRIVTTKNEMYQTRTGEYCIMLNPGNTVEIVLEYRPSREKTEIISARILSGDELNGRLAV